MKKNGFTLIELIVAVFIFTFLTIIAGGSFVSALNLQRRAVNIKKIEENGRFVLELMARELRVAAPINTSNTSCPASWVSTISFEHPVNGSIEYSLNGTQAQRRVNGVATMISNPDIEITRLNFCVTGNTEGDNRQPKVTIIMSLRSGGLASQTAAVDLQTSITQRMPSD
jgi:prepilin-type N-terminal cleavage/methylation domain-containing protein